MFHTIFELKGDDMSKKFIYTSYLSICIMLSAESFGGESFYTTRIEDPYAVYLTKEAFPVYANGIVDDTDALQQASSRRNRRWAVHRSLG